MPTYHTPGVHIEQMLTEPARVLRTGVPVFLGLIRKEDLNAYNAQQPKADERFVCKPNATFSNASIARKRGYLRLPKRLYSASDEIRVSDHFASPRSFYLRAGQACGPAEDEQDIEQAIDEKPQRFTVWPQFEAAYGDVAPFGFLTYAVRGFFENLGPLCYVQLICFEKDSISEALQMGLSTLEAYDDFDLVCVPDIMWSQTDKDIDPVRDMQTSVIEHCNRLGNRFAILDSLPLATQPQILAQRQQLISENAALYYPWVEMRNGPGATDRFVPPCGHVAGVFARTDLTVGVHKAPANELLQGVVNLAVNLNNDQQGPLNDLGVNCLRAFPRRGIRVWGARTLSHDLNWRYVNVRRIFLTAIRWIERNMLDVVFEPQGPQLWARIVHDLTAYLTDLFEHGAFAGLNVSTSFYVKCDAETNPPEVQEAGQVVTEIGLAPAAPAEFIVVRIIHGPTGANISGPA